MSVQNQVMVNPAWEVPSFVDLLTSPKSKGPIISDFQVGSRIHVLVRYSRQTHLHDLREFLKDQFGFRRLPVQVLIVIFPGKVDEGMLEDVQNLCVFHHFSVVPSFSQVQAAKMVDTLFAHRNSTSFRIEAKLTRISPMSSTEDLKKRAAECLDAVGPLNKTDIQEILTCYGGLSKIFQSSAASLESISGLGPKKIEALRSTFEADFSGGPKREAPVSLARLPVTPTDESDIVPSLKDETF